MKKWRHSLLGSLAAGRRHGAMPRDNLGRSHTVGRADLDLLGPGLSVLGQAVSRKILRLRHLPKGVNRYEIQAEVFHDIPARSAALLRGRHVLILNFPDRGSRFIDAARSRSAVMTCRIVVN